MATLPLGLTACDTMIMDKMVITPYRTPVEGPTAEQVMDAAHESLEACRVREEHLSRGASSWVWRNPEKPPGLSIDLRWEQEQWHVVLSQHLFGPIGPTDTYSCVRQSLKQVLQRTFGKDQVAFT